ncbi:MAG: hypothetical protein ACJ79L_09530, partial [Anaeromyxobacteraceae bacterium]
RLAGFAVGALVAPALLWLFWRGTGGERPSGDASDARLASAPVTEASPEPPDGGAAALPGLAGAPPAPAEATPADAGAAPAAAREDGFDGPAWQRSKVVFRTRDLGKLGPHVQSGLDAARRDMEFCYAQAPARRDAAPEPPPDPEQQDATEPPARPDPAMLLLFLEAREGALDVVEARTEHRGTSSAELVECCREVLRGMEIKAFGAVPGRRYRVKFRLR